MREKVDPESKLNTFVSATPPKRRYRYRILVIPETEILAMTMKYTTVSRRRILDNGHSLTGKEFRMVINDINIILLNRTWMRRMTRVKVSSLTRASSMSTLK